MLRTAITGITLISSGRFHQKDLGTGGSYPVEIQRMTRPDYTNSSSDILATAPLSFASRDIDMLALNVRAPYFWSIVALSLSVCLVGCKTDFKDDFRDQVESEDIEQFEQVSGISFPEGAKFEGIWIQQLPAKTISLKVSMSEKASDALLKKGPVTEDDLVRSDEYDPNDSEQSSFPPNRGWWNPGTQVELRVGSKVLDTGGILSVGVLPPRRKGPTIVFLTWDEQSSEE